MIHLIGFLIGLVAYTACLWLAAKITKTDARFLELLVIAVIASAVSLIPGIVGWVLSSIVFFLLLYKWMNIDPIPDAILMVVVAKGLEYGLIFVILQLCASGPGG
jgi:hypothetical protein